MAETIPHDTLLAEVPVGVARALVDSAQAAYAPRLRDSSMTAAAAITVLGVASDIISLALAREAITDLVTRTLHWGHAREDQSELTLRVGDHVDLRLRVTGPRSDEQVVAVVDQLLEVLRAPRP